MNQFIDEILNLEKNGCVEDILRFDSKLDAYFGLDITKVEASLDATDEQAYIGLDFRALLTSYIDYYSILKRIPCTEILVDLGAGHCRGTLLSVLLQTARCVSYEFVEKRTLNAQKYLSNLVCAKNDKMIFTENMATSSLLEAYAYYLYFPRGEVLDIILRKLFKIAEQKEILIYVCESHGDLIEYIKGFRILAVESEFKCRLPRHYNNIVCFKLKFIAGYVGDWKDNIPLWLLLFADKDEYVLKVSYFHLLRKKKMQWLVPLKDVEWLIYQGRECLQFRGRRIIEISKTERILGIEKIDSELETLLNNNSYKKIFICDDIYEFDVV